MKLWLSFILLATALPLAAQNDRLLSEYRLIIVNFKFENALETNKELIRSIPEAIEHEVATYPNLFTLAREQHLEILEEIEYQYDRPDLFEETSKAKLKKQVGANVALVGKIRQGDRRHLLGSLHNRR